MSGITRLLAKELSSALGITDNPKFNPMFKQTDEVLTDVADPSDPTVARFYSPLESALDEAPIGKEGTRGENVEAFVRKRAPKVSKAEMEFRGLGLEPGELYTAESAKESLKGLNIKAVNRGKGYRLEQRQSNLKDRQLDYVELSIEAEENLNYPPNYHYGSSNLAHTRYSVREPKELKESGNSLFSSDAIDTAKKQNDKSREILVYMPINDFLKAAKSIAGEPLEASQSKLKNTMGLLESNTPFSSIPSLTFKNNGDGTGKVVGHEGRHRAMAINALGLNERGTSQIPVILRSEAGAGPSIRWGQQSNPDSFDYVDKLPTKLISEEGKGTISIPARARPEIVRSENKPYILIEELQSDVIQNTAENAQEAAARHSQVLKEDLNMNYNSIKFQIDDKGSGFPDKVVDDIKYYIEDVVIPTNLNTKLSDSDKIKVYQEALKRIDADQDIIEGVGKAGDVFPTVNGILQREFDEFDDLMEEIADDINDTVSIYIQTALSTISKKDLPVQRITDTIRMSLQAIISDAKARGIDEIVLPPVDKLAYQRFKLDEIPSKIAKGSAFYNTYVASYNKVLKQLKSELGNQIKIGKKPLKYRTGAGKISARTAKGKVLKKPPKYETVQGTLLDISNLTIDPKNTKLRFSEGGLVQRRTK